jgi:ornithine cyclodeaminase/alanine dehydrogenase-like protein (mu-crystallin family)
LSDLVSGRVPGRGADDEITCFSNDIGLGLQFAAIGALIMEKIQTMDIANKLTPEWFSETVHP